MPLPLGERILLRKALVLRRVFDGKSVPIDQLLKFLEEDEELVREKAPQFYYADANFDLRAEIDDCVDDGLIEWTIPIGSGQTLRRTKLGNQFMQTLEPRLQNGVDDMPMSGDAILDFLASM